MCIFLQECHIEPYRSVFSLTKTLGYNVLALFFFFFRLFIVIITCLDPWELSETEPPTKEHTWSGPKAPSQHM